MTHKRFTVYYPDCLLSQVDSSELYGFFHEDTGCFVVTERDVPGSQLLSDDLNQFPLTAFPTEDGGITFRVGRYQCTSNSYGISSDLFSRHLGLLENSDMKACKALICGCGSVGSLVALELARSGVGSFLLIDQDILSIENLCRHQCGISDVGRHKVNAVADKIKLINPWSDVIIVDRSIERVDPAIIADFSDEQTIFIGCADSRRADSYLAKLSVKLRAPFLSIGLWERAFAGEIFYHLPESDSPCFSCALDQLVDSVSQRPEEHRPFYTTEKDLEKASFQPAISIDISYVTMIGIKLAVDILCRRSNSYVPRVLSSLSQFTLVCNSNDERLGGHAADIFSHPLQVTTSIHPVFGDGCPPCKIRSK
jgi:molybdopterin/thiamine biosynthesis adenylyltransferase